MKRCRVVRHLDIRFVLHEDHVILPPEAVLKDDGTPYTVFTPYSRKWHKVLEAASPSAG